MSARHDPQALRRVQGRRSRPLGTGIVTLQDALARPTPGKLVTLSQGAGHSLVTAPDPSVTDSNGQIAFVVGASRDAIERGVNAGDILRQALAAAGGKGGKGRSESSGYVSPTAGQAGGTALYTRAYVNVTYGAAGKLRGGGGGGGGSATGDGSDLVGGGGGGGAGTIVGPAGPAGTGTQTAEAGQPGTAETGGLGGRSWTKNTPFAFAKLDSNYRGGTGGDIGLAGSDGADQYSHSGASGGAAGKAIDGASYVTQSGTPASLLGGQVN